jgi:LytR cell envelope-related transcriptional attenuator
MNQRESSGLPLRAMVMVLLFLGVVFLLVAFQAMGSDDDAASSETSVVTTTTAATSTTTTTSVAPARPEVRVYNVSDVVGAAENTATRLRDQQWDAKAEDLSLVEIPPVTTVYFGSEPGEEDAANEVGAILEAPVAPRLAELVDQPPGVIVVVTG